MANDPAAPLEQVAEGLQRSNLEPNYLKVATDAIRKAADELAADNAAAAKKAEERFDAALRHYVENPRLYSFGGFCNLVGCVATLCGRMTDTTPEGSEAEADWQFAEQVLDATLAAVDLHYGERSSKKQRQEALARLRELVAEIEA